MRNLLQLDKISLKQGSRNEVKKKLLGKKKKQLSVKAMFTYVA